QNGHFYICNCCGCCCGVLRSITEHGIRGAVNSAFYAVIDPDECVACGICADERCQVGAIEEGEDAYVIIKEKCIGCGLCISTCATEAISLVRKEASEIVIPPATEDQWFEDRAQNTGRDMGPFK
ncbi:MAG: 4Fe-4S binding protein, partial [Pseudomonadota bacterium]